MSEKYFFDLSVLLNLRAGDLGRTGVFTYTAGLAEAFLEKSAINFRATQGGYANAFNNENQLITQTSERIFPKGILKKLATLSHSTIGSKIGLKHRIDRAAAEWSGYSGDMETSSVLHLPWFGRWPVWSQNRKQWRCCLTVHDLIAWRHPEWFDEKVKGYREKWTRCIHGADFLICDSENTREDLLEYFPQISSKQSYVVHLGPSFIRPDVECLLSREDLLSVAKVPSHKPYFLSLCTLEPRKNLVRLIQAFTHFRSVHHDEALLVLVGAQGWGESLEMVLEQAGVLRKDIILTGYLPDELLPSLYYHCLAFVYPSLYEGFGLPVLDAMTMGAPVIASKVSSMPEITGSNACLVDPYSVDDIADALYQIAKDADLRMKLQRDGQLRSAQFSWVRCAEETMAAYENALGKR